MKRSPLSRNKQASLLGIILVFLLISLIGCASEQEPESDVLRGSSAEVRNAVVQEGYYDAESFVESSDPNAIFSLMFSYGISEQEHLDALLDYALSTIPNDSEPFYFAYLRVKEGTEERVLEEISDTLKTAYPSYVISQMEHYGSPDSVGIAKEFVFRLYKNGILLFTALPSDRDFITGLAEGSVSP